MGMLFLVGQVVAWSQYIMRGVVVSTSPHSGFFYVLTAAHAAHVIGGLVGLGLLAVWQRHQWKFTTVPVLSRVTAVYWHFLGLLWLTRCRGWVRLETTFGRFHVRSISPF